MPRKRNVVPSYLFHSPTGQAYTKVWVGSKKQTIYLGPHGSEVSRQEFARIVGEAAVHTAKGGPPPATLTVNELMAEFRKHADEYYRRADGTPTNEVVEYRLAARVVRELYGHVPATEFGPLALRAVREKMLAAGLSRKSINGRVDRVKRIWKWAAGLELVPFATFHALTAVTGLRQGRTSARESEPVRPVADAVVDATLPFLRRPVRGLVTFGRLTGCRPAEACSVRPSDIDQSAELWVYRPGQFKTLWQGKTRTILLGPKARALLEEFTPADPTHYFFPPTGRPHAHYRTDSYDRAVARACERAGVPHWSPNQLRHTHGTTVRKLYGLEAAGAALGHTKMSATQIYAERDGQLAERVAREVG